MLHPIRLLALAIAIAIAGADPTEPHAQKFDDTYDASESIFDAHVDGTPLEHAAVAEPSDISDAEAERIYQAILSQMQAGYSASGDPLAQAYVRWRRYNTVPYLSQRHGRVFVNNYANEVAALYGSFPQGDGLPAGSLIVKDSFIVSDTGEIRAGPLAIMEKMPAGYDPDNADWRYLVIGPDGTVVGVSAEGGNDPRMTQCAACHAGAPRGQDRLFYVPPGRRR